MSAQLNGVNVTIQGPCVYVSVNWIGGTPPLIHVYVDSGVSLFLDAEFAAWLSDKLYSALANRPAPPAQLSLPFPPKEDVA